MHSTNELKIWVKCHISLFYKLKLLQKSKCHLKKLMFQCQSANHAYHLLSHLIQWAIVIHAYRHLKVLFKSWDVRFIKGQKWRFSFSLSDHMAPFLTWALKILHPKSSQFSKETHERKLAFGKIYIFIMFSR